MLLAYPPRVRRDHAAEIASALADDLARQRGWRGRMRWLGRAAADIVASWRSGRPQSSRARRPERAHGRQLADDIATASRVFKQAPLVTLGAIVTLGLGIGAATAVFSLADATLLRPLPVWRADRVVQSTFSWSHPDCGRRVSIS